MVGQGERANISWPDTPVTLVLVSFGSQLTVSNNQRLTILRSIFFTYHFLSTIVDLG